MPRKKRFPRRPPPYSTVESLRGVAGSLPKPLSWQEVEEIVAEDRAEAYIAKHGKPDVIVPPASPC